MTICSGNIVICVFVIATTMLLDVASSQPGFTNTYPKYKFMFNVEDEGLHKREEESSAEGHVSGIYSYMDPNGNLRTIKYNSTPETGFLAYGDTGVFANSIRPITVETPPTVLRRKVDVPSAESHMSRLYSYMIPGENLQTIKYNSTPETGFPAYGSTAFFSSSSKPFTLEHSAGTLEHGKDNNLDNNIVEKFSDENVHVSQHSELPSATDNTASLLLPGVEIVATSLTNNSIDEAKKNGSSKTGNTKQNRETSNKISFDLMHSEPQDDLVSNGIAKENISDVNTIESTVFKNTQLKGEMQNIYKIDHSHLSQHYPLNIPINIVPYFIHPMPHWMALHPQYRFVL